MAYRLVTVPAARKSFKKLPREARKSLIDRLEILKTNPQAGEQLERPWQVFRSFHALLAGVQYRAVYEVDLRQRLIIIRYAATRENFYKELRRLKLKPLSA
jgi:mRNA-degrading endonuclease RelE of RelBE toxin-antitoxin system